MGEFPLDRMVPPEGDVSGEPGKDQIFIGEAVSVSGEGSCQEEKGVECMLEWWGDPLAWVETAEAWGCAIEAVVVSSPHNIHLVSHAMLLTH